MLVPGDRIVVALSGGPDSVALLGALAGLAAEFGVSVCAAHFNHGLRGDESLRDQHCAENVARRLGIDLVVGRSSALDHGANLEARAREQRYAFLTRTAEGQSCTKIATGHTLDDQAETVLMRLLRGSGPEGLAGIQPVRDGRIIRPLIECSRAEVLAFLHAADLPFCQDSSNRDLRFLRNRIRHEVMPLLESIQPAAKRRLAAAGQLVTDEVGLLRAQDAALLARVVGPDGALPVAALLGAPSTSGTRLARAWLRECRGDLHGLTMSHFRAIAGLAEGRRPNAQVVLPRGQRVLREYDRLLFCGRDCVRPPEPHRLLVPGSAVCLESGWRITAELQPVQAVSWQRPADLFEAVADAVMVPGPLVVRTLRVGDKIQPLGVDGHRKLQDVLVDRKVPIRTRRSCPIVEFNGEVLWVPGIVRSCHGLVSANTRAALRLTAEKPAIAGN